MAPIILWIGGEEVSVFSEAVQTAVEALDDFFSELSELAESIEDLFDKIWMVPKQFKSCNSKRYSAHKLIKFPFWSSARVHKYVWYTSGFL